MSTVDVSAPPPAIAQSSPWHRSPPRGAGSPVRVADAPPTVDAPAAPKTALAASVPAVAAATAAPAPPKPDAIQLAAAQTAPIPEPAPTPAAAETKSDLPPAPTSGGGAQEGATVAGWTLDALQQLAETNHPTLTVASRAVESARGRALQAGLYPNPMAATSSPQWAGSDSQFNGYVSQDIVTAGKLKLDVAAVCREVQQAEYHWRQARMEIFTAVRQQFYVTLAAQTRVALQQRLVHLASQSRDVAEKLFRAGEGTRGDVLLMEIEADRNRVALRNAEIALSVARRQLTIAIGLPDILVEQLVGDLDAVLPDYELEALRLQIPLVHPAASAARVEVDRTGIRLHRALVEPIPNVNVMGGYQRQLSGPFENQGLFQVMLEVPLWDRNQGNIFAAEAQMAGARADVQRVELDLASQAADAVTEYRTAHQIVQTYDQEILPKARETFRLTQELYTQGQVDFLRILQAQRTLIETELSRIDAQTRRWIAAATLAGLLQQEQFP